MRAGRANLSSAPCAVKLCCGRFEGPAVFAASSFRNFNRRTAWVPGMTDVAASDFRHPRRYVRLDTILRLRWLAVLGQLGAIFIVVQGLEFDVEVVPCVAIVGLSALLNLVLQISFDPMQRLEPA